MTIHCGSLGILSGSTQVLWSFEFPCGSLEVHCGILGVLSGSFEVPCGSYEAPSGSVEVTCTISSVVPQSYYDFTRFNPYRNPRTIPTPLLIWCLGGEEFLGLLPC